MSPPEPGVEAEPAGEELKPEELTVRDGEYPPEEHPLETAWTFWYDKKTSNRKESDQYIEGLRQLGSFNTIEGFYRHYAYLLRPSELPRDHNVLLFRKGYKPMWEEFPEGGCWIIRIKRKVSLNYVNRMWENLLLSCVGEAFDMPDVVGCVLSTRLKDDVLSVWNLSNRRAQARFRIGEKLKEILDLDMNALIQYKDHMQSLQDYSTYRNAKNYMFAPSPTCTPQMEGPPNDVEFDLQGMLPPSALDEMLPTAAVDTDPSYRHGEEEPWAASSSSARRPPSSPGMRAAAAPYSPSSAAMAAAIAVSPMVRPAEPPLPAVPELGGLPASEEVSMLPRSAGDDSAQAGESEGATPAPKSWATMAAAAEARSQAAAAAKAPPKAPGSLGAAEFPALGCPAPASTTGAEANASASEEVAPAKAPKGARRCDDAPLSYAAMAAKSASKAKPP